LVVLASATSNTPREHQTLAKQRSRLPVAARITAARRRIIVANYGSGLSTRAVAEKNHVSKTTVLKALAEAGVPRRLRGGH
jgi:hypothetical protein